MTELAFERLPNERDRDELLENERRVEPEHAIAEPTKRAVLARISPTAPQVHKAIDFHEEGADVSRVESGESRDRAPGVHDAVLDRV